MREQERAPRKYELMTVLHPEVAEEALPGELDRIAGYISDAGGELIESLRDSPWGRRRLAYPIRSGGRDVRDGYYTVWHFSIGPRRLDALERELKLNTQIIRYLVVSWEPRPPTAKELEAAEIAAEESAAAEYAAAQAAQAATEAEAAQTEHTAELTAAAEAAEASGAALAIEPVETGAETAIEPVAAVAERAELEEEAAAALAKAAEAAAAEVPAEAAAEAPSSGEEIPAGAIRGSESGECPDDYPVKGNASSRLYHVPGSPAYKRTMAEFCFASVEAAEAAGFGPTKFEAAQEQGSESE